MNILYGHRVATRQRSARFSSFFWPFIGQIVKMAHDGTGLLSFILWVNRLGTWV